MTVATPTVLPRPQLFPRLLPDPPRPHPVPLPAPGKGNYGNMRARRDLQRELNDLSDEEKELEELNTSIRNRGYAYMIPIGRTLTVQEEKNDADEESEGEGGSETGESANGPPSGLEEDADTTQDLDAEMEDMDEEGENSDENEMEEADSEDFEEGPSTNSEI